MEEDVLVLSYEFGQSAAPLPNSSIISKVDTTGLNILWRHRVNETGDLLRKTAVTSKELQEDDRKRSR